MSSNFTRLMAQLWMLLSLLLSVNAQEETPNINAGATVRSVGAPLLFAKGDAFEAGFGWTVPLRISADEPYTGWFHNEIVFGALPATGGFGGPYPDSALSWTKIHLEVTNVEGPPGGEFTSWQTRSKTPAIRVLSGTANSTNDFIRRAVSPGTQRKNGRF